MAEDKCGADTQANDLFTSLTADAPTVPTLDLSGPEFELIKDSTSDLHDPISVLTLEQLTEGTLTGSGVFDVLMGAMDKHIQREYKGNRITGDQYAKVYTEVITAVLGQSVAFLLQRDQAKWNAITAQMQARVAEVEASKAVIEYEETKVKAQQSTFEMYNSGAQYALTKMQVANADAEHCLTDAKTKAEVYRYTSLMPAELSIQEYTRQRIMPIEYAAKQVTANRILPAEASIKEFENRVLQPLEEGIQTFQLEQVLPTQQATAEFQLNQMLPVTLGKEQHLLNFQMPAQTDLIQEQRETQRAQTLETRSDTLTPISGLVGRQKNLLDEQISLTTEQKEAERSKTMDTRSDGSTIVEGMNGKQKDLYDQQIDSFIKDAKQKTAKMYLDGWITQKTLDENFSIPTQLTTPEIDQVLSAIRTTNSL